MVIRSSFSPPPRTPKEVNDELEAELTQQAKLVIDAWAAAEPRKALLKGLNPSVNAAQDKHSPGGEAYEIAVPLELPWTLPQPSFYDDHGKPTQITPSSALIAILKEAIRFEHIDIGELSSNEKKAPPIITYGSRNFVIQFPVGQPPEECKSLMKNMAEGLKSQIEYCVQKYHRDVVTRSDFQQEIRDDFTPGG